MRGTQDIKEIRYEISMQTEKTIRDFEADFIYDKNNNYYNGVVENKYTDGIYKGDVDDMGRRHGYGIFMYYSSAIYAGQWLEDMQTGQGVHVFENQDRYEGQLLGGKKHGQGRYYFYKNGNTYNGNWKNDTRDGYGEFIYRLSNEKYLGRK